MIIRWTKLFLVMLALLLLRAPSASAQPATQFLVAVGDAYSFVTTNGPTVMDKVGMGVLWSYEGSISLCTDGSAFALPWSGLARFRSLYIANQGPTPHLGARTLTTLIDQGLNDALTDVTQIGNPPPPHHYGDYANHKHRKDNFALRYQGTTFPGFTFVNPCLIFGGVMDQTSINLGVFFQKTHPKERSYTGQGSGHEGHDDD